jgi:2,4-dienoyl-CoA reductase-like NADH-dependent reductase (Old Yellow Enzyme family)/thioredoxin reductase
MMLQKKTISPMFPMLFEPRFIGKLWLKNRLVRAAIMTSYADMNGCVTERVVRHYWESARGGAGLVIVESAYIDDKASKSGKCMIGVSRDEHKPGLQWLASAIRANGARACLQIEHCGRQKGTGTPPIKAPSRVPNQGFYGGGAPPPEELTFEEILEIIGAFGDAAFRAKQVGFDAVEVQGSHGYLITNFLSSHTNKRADCYGGSLRNRMRFLLELIDNIRRKVGPDYPLSVRLSGTDYAENEPITIEETIEVAKALEKVGIDAIHVSGGDGETIHKQVAPMYLPVANNVWAAEAIKKVVNITVIASGSITTPELAEKILKEGKADLVSLARPLLADPYYPSKAQEGRPEDICPCIRCLDGCVDRGVRVGGIKCSVNATLGNEDNFRIARTAKPKKVVVVGGGPAGMEAARVAALRGHEVTLFEKRELGGMLIEASVPDFKADLRRLVNYLSIQLSKTGVKIVAAEATAEIIRDGKFDTVIVATGATPRIPDVSGVSKRSVVGILDILRGAATGKRVITVGGGLLGCDVALFLAEQGKEVIITTRADSIGRDMDQVSRQGFLERLSKQNIEIRTGVYLVEITDDGVSMCDKEGEKTEIKGDNVVLAAGLSANRGLFDDLSSVPTLEVFAVGDCAEPRKILDAIHEGYQVAFGL